MSNLIFHSVRNLNQLVLFLLSSSSKTVVPQAQKKKKKGQIYFWTPMCPTYPIHYHHTSPSLLSLFGWSTKGILHFVLFLFFHANTPLSLSLTLPPVPTHHRHLHHLFSGRSPEKFLGTSKHLYIFYLR